MLHGLDAGEQCGVVGEVGEVGEHDETTIESLNYRFCIDL